MPDLTITIGGRSFQVSCQPGEEHFLQSAAAMLNAEAEPLVRQLGKLPETRLLLMAGLMLADKTAALEDEVRSLKARLAEGGGQPDLPPEVVGKLADLANRAEKLATKIERLA